MSLDICEGKPLFGVRAQHGEGPVWDATAECFYWIDMMEGRFFRAGWDSGLVETFEVGQPIGVISPTTTEGEVVMALRDGFYTFDLRSSKLTELMPTEKECEDTRFNDGAVDPAGRLWAATMCWDGSRPVGRMYRLGPDASVSSVLDGLYLSNGIGWTVSGKTMFHVDTMTHRVDAYDFDRESGHPTRRRMLINFGVDELPDGLTVDSEDHLWIALYGSGRIDRYTPDGKLAGRILTPVTHPTSCCFGGPDNTDLLVTTSRRDLTPREVDRQPLAGRCIRYAVGIRGQYEPKYIP